MKKKEDGFEWEFGHRMKRVDYVQLSDRDRAVLILGALICVLFAAITGCIIGRMLHQLPY